MKFGVQKYILVSFVYAKAQHYNIKIHQTFVQY